MKYVSIDVETTGLNPVMDSVLEFAAVYDCISRDPERCKITDLPSLRILVVPESLRCSAYVAKLHYRLWEEMELADRNQLNDEGWYDKDPGDRNPLNQWNFVSRPEYVCKLFCEWLDLFEAFYGTDEGDAIHTGARKVNAAGKNFSAFDLPFIQNLPNWDSVAVSFRRRVMDPALAFWHPGDESLPDLKLCMKRAGYGEFAVHTALGDARAVACLVRCAFPLGHSEVVTQTS
jgi:hypothetical protein